MRQSMSFSGQAVRGEAAALRPLLTQFWQSETGHQRQISNKGLLHE